MSECCKARVLSHLGQSHMCTVFICSENRGLPSLGTYRREFIAEDHRYYLPCCKLGYSATLAKATCAPFHLLGEQGFSCFS